MRRSAAAARDRDVRVRLDLWRWHAARAYAPDHWDRLQDVRARRDPDGLFHAFPAPATSAA
jgi:hypothetical protein